MLAVVQVRVDAGDAVGPDRAAQATHVHGLVDDELTGETGEETQSNGVDAELLESEGDVEALAVGGVVGGAGTDVLVGNETAASDRHIHGGIGGEGVEHRNHLFI